MTFLSCQKTTYNSECTIFKEEKLVR